MHGVILGIAGLRPISLLTLHPAKIAWLKLSGKSPMGLRIPHLNNNIMLESNPLTSTMLAGRLAVVKKGFRGIWLLPCNITWGPKGWYSAEITTWAVAYKTRLRQGRYTNNTDNEQITLMIASTHLLTSQLLMILIVACCACVWYDKVHLMILYVLII